MRDLKQRIELKDESIIPEGLYCWSWSGACPYWTLREDKPRQDNGYCLYLEESDWESDGLSLLWDQVKECCVKDSLPEIDNE